MTENEAIQLVMIMQAAYPAATVRKETAKAYHLGLADIPYADAERAVVALMRTSKFMPTVAEIRETLTDAAVDIEPWETAWDEVIATINRYGSYLHHPARGWPGWSDALVEGAINHVGYETVCKAESDNLSTVRAQFRNYYENEAKRRKKLVQTGDAALPRGNVRALKKGDVA